MNISKKQRQKHIKDLLKVEHITTQATLQQRLKEEFNIETDRSTISRDMKELGITREVSSKSLKFTKDALTKDLKTQIFYLLESHGESFFHTPQKNIMSYVFQTEPQTAVIVAGLLERLFADMTGFAAFANNAGKILLVYPEVAEAEVLRVLNSIADADF